MWAALRPPVRVIHKEKDETGATSRNEVLINALLVSTNTGENATSQYQCGPSFYLHYQIRRPVWNKPRSTLVPAT